MAEPLVVDPPLCASLVERFPYLIVFEHVQLETDVLGASHTARDVFWKEIACAVSTTLTAGRGAHRPT